MAIYCNGYAPVKILDARMGDEGGLFIKTERTGAYCDGSGAKNLPEPYAGGKFVHCCYFKADEGFKEISDAVAAIYPEYPKNPGAIPALQSSEEE